MGFSRLLVLSTLLLVFWYYRRRRKAMYRYAPLSGRRQIRLVQILATDPSESITCSFRHVSLDEKPSYKAISYCWGPDQPRHKVIIDAKGQLEINESLAGILRWLASSNRDGWFWIDALCINQADAREKSTQVQMMMDIFAGAKEVLAWLGPPADNSNLAVRFVPILERAFRNLMEEDLPTDMEHLKSVPECDRRSLYWPALRKLLRRPWFTRAWIVQEVAVAKTIILHCGDSGLSWESLYYVLSVDFAAGLHQLTWNKSSKFSDAPDERDIILIGGMKDRLIQGDLPRLSTNLVYYRTFDASNERDHIYAFLGISDDREDPALRPDYRKDVESVYTDVARHLLIQQSRNIGRRYRDWQTRTFQLQMTHCPLIHAAGIGWERKLSTLPSWVPDWTSNKRAFLGALEEIGEYEASLKSDFDVGLGSDMNSIILKGHDVDMVERVYSLGETSYQSELGTDIVHIPKPPLEWISGTLSAIQMREPYFGNNPRENRACVLSTVLTANLLCHRSPLDFAQGVAEIDIADDFASYLKAATHAAGIGDTTGWFEKDYKRAHFVRIVMSMIEGKVLFSTQTGLLGIGPPLMQAGDRVFLVNGTCTPFIFRLASRKRLWWTAWLLRSAPKWHLVGDCYVHGLMRGEGIEMAKAQRIVVC